MPATKKKISPGVFTEEIDVSFVPAALEAVGAAVIGQTEKGPAFVPTKVSNFDEFQELFGGMDPELWTPYAARFYLKNSNALTVCRVCGENGYVSLSGFAICLSGDTAAPNRILGIIRSDQPFTLAGTTNDFDLGFNSDAFSITDLTLLRSGSTGFIKNCLSYDPTKPSSSANHYLFNKEGYGINIYVDNLYEWAASGAAQTIYLQQLSYTTGSDFTFQYQAAETPIIVSKPVNENVFDLFQIETRADGAAANIEFKVSIENIKSDGTFSIIIREWDDTDKRNSVLEQFHGLTIDPGSTDWVKRRIGDRKEVFAPSTQEISWDGDYDNVSKYIRVKNVEEGPFPTNDDGDIVLQVGGFHSYVGFIEDSGHNYVYEPELPFKLDQLDENNTVNSKIRMGIDVTKLGIADRLKKRPDYTDTAALTATRGFLLAATADMGSLTSQYMGIPNTSTTAVSSLDNFALPVSQGFDGFDMEQTLSGRIDFSTKKDSPFTDTETTSVIVDTVGYSDLDLAITRLGNADETDFNLLMIPGITQMAVVLNGIEMVEDRGDALYIADITDLEDSIDTAITNAENYNTSYGAAFYPWVKIYDTDHERHVWIPASAVVGGAIALNDKVAYPWYAPAGLTRGSLSDVKEARRRLTQANRDTLYSGRVNPVATFPKEGVVVWGQKTLQKKASALDRINVRRLLLYSRKLIASIAKLIVFDPNDASTRNRFVNLINPILENIQVNKGLYQFKVVCDETNNTPDVIDRNQMVAQIFLQPTKAAEIVTVEFNITRTGVLFEEV